LKKELFVYVFPKGKTGWKR